MRIINKKRFIKSIVTIIIAVITVLMTINFCKYPEQYITTWKYQLKQDIASGDQEAIDYYQEVYLDNNKTLW